MSKQLILAMGLVLATTSACGGEEGLDPIDQPPDTWTNTAPVLHVASPGKLAVGESLTILGHNFIDANKGQLLMVLKGTFFDDAGQAQQVNLQVKPKRINSGKISWKLWPNIVFDQNGDSLGYFVGSVAVANLGKDGSQMYSQNLPVRVDVKPSLIPRLVRPKTGNCQAVVKATLEDQPMAFTVEAVGLRPATSDAPITFYWTLMASQWQASLTYNTMDPQASVFPKTGAFMLEDVVTKGQASSISGAGDRNLILKVGSDVLGSGGLKVLKTGKNADGAEDSFDTTINVAAVDASGKSVKVSIPLEVFRVASMHYNGKVEIAERYAPVQVSDCIPGGDIGRNVTYSEDKSESRVRSMSFQYNASVGANISPIPGNPFALGINFSVGFGVDTSASLSSSSSKGLNISGQILPGEYGAFYRQTTKVQRVGKLVGHGYCGQTIDLGSAILTDWMFTPDLATGSTCVPPTKLQPAQKFK